MSIAPTEKATVRAITARDERVMDAIVDRPPGVSDCTRSDTGLRWIDALPEPIVRRMDSSKGDVVLDGDPAENADEAARNQMIAQAAGLPLALLFAWLAVRTSPGAVRMLGMWVHESGHAVTAWVCGYTAWPGPWFTPVSAERSPSFTVLLIGLLAYGGYHAWKIERRFWIAASAIGILLVLSGSLLLAPATAQQLIIFGGDGGCLVLGTMLMLTVYARADHPMRRNHLRWGFLVIGALAFMDVYAVWSGPIEIG